MKDDVIVINGKRFVGTSRFLYELKADNSKVRVSKAYFDKQCAEEVESTTINPIKKDIDMKESNNTVSTYAEKVEMYGVDVNWIASKFGKYAYKPMWKSTDGKEMSGEFLVIHNGEPMMIRELTFKGKMIVNKLENFKLLGMFQDWDRLVDNMKVIGEFVTHGKLETKQDETDFDSQWEMALSQDKELVEVIKFKLGVHELVGFLNTHSGMMFGTRPYCVYEAEQKLRIKPKDLDSQFDDALDAQIKQNKLYREASFEEVTYTSNTVGGE